MLMLGGSQPDLRAPPSEKLKVGAARMGTPRKRKVAPVATPSLDSKSIARLRALICQAGASSPTTGQVL